ncbi:MAG: 50S ribosomal protein L25 [Dehalococcoidia bacterium]
MARKELTVEPRQVTGKKVATLRRAGVLPANVFGKGLESVALQIDLEQLQTTLKTMTANEVLDLKIAGERAARPVIISKLQRHPYNGTWLHADFYQVSLREKMKADVPITVIGESEAIKTYNGVLMMGIETVSVEALPLDLPTHFEIDISHLAHLEDTLHVSDIPVESNVTILTDPEVVVLKIASPRVSTEEGEEAPAAVEAPVAEAEGEETSAEAEPEAEASAD